MKDIVRESMLFDFYGGLLTDKKQQVMELYYDDDLSLAEIAEEFGISRTAVYDSLKKSEAALEGYENKLGLISKFEKRKAMADEIIEICDRLEKFVGNISPELSRIKELAKELGKE